MASILLPCSQWAPTPTKLVKAQGGAVAGLRPPTDGSENYTQLRMECLGADSLRCARRAFRLGACLLHLRLAEVPVRVGLPDEAQLLGRGAHDAVHGFARRVGKQDTVHVRG